MTTAAAATATECGWKPHAPVIDPTRFYTLGEAAKLSGFGRKVLAARCAAGVLAGRRAAGRGWWKVSGADLLAFLRASGVPSAGPTPPKAKAQRRRRDAVADDFDLLERAWLA